MKFAAIALVLSVCSGCAMVEKVKVPVRAGETYVIPETEWRVVDRRTMEKLYKSAGMKIDKYQKLEGFSARSSEGKIIIYTLEPVIVDGKVTTTLGHELMHITLGDFHNNQ